MTIFLSLSRRKNGPWGRPGHEILDLVKGVEINNLTDFAPTLFVDQKHGRYNFQLYVVHDIRHF